MLLRNSEFPAKGIFCFDLSFTVAVKKEALSSKNRVPEKALLCQDTIKVPTGMIFAYPLSRSTVIAQLRAEAAIKDIAL